MANNTSNAAEVFSKNLANLVENNYDSYRDAALRMGVAQSTLRRYALGERVPSIDMLAQVAAFFNVSADWLIGLSSYKFRTSSSAEQNTDLIRAINSASDDDKALIRDILNHQLSGKDKALIKLILSND